jgi:hypothetical protein
VQAIELSAPLSGAMLKEIAMQTLEERVAYLEGQVSDFDTRFDQLERRFEARFDQLERRFETRFDVIDRRFEGLDDKVARHFTWLVAIQVTTLVAIIGALLARA